MKTKNNIILRIQEELQKNSDEITKNSGKRFFKEDIKLYGVKSATVGKIANTFFKEVQKLSKNEIFDICDELLLSGFMEEAFIAYNWSDKLEKLYTESDFKIFEKWLATHVSNWAECDTLCNHTIGSFVTKNPQFIKNLKNWTSSKNRWVKRGAAVSLIIPAKRGLFLKDIFEIADKLLLDPDDLVQKGYGWMLKAASQAHQKEVFNYVIKNKNSMPRTALRYAIEKMPTNLKKLAMSK